MTQTILFPPAVGLVMDYLKDKLPLLDETAPVHGAVPSTRPSSFVVIRRTGGRKPIPVIDRAQISWETWAANGPRAELLAGKVEALILAMTSQVVSDAQIYDVTVFAGSAFFPDPDSKTPRYVGTLIVPIRGTAAT